MKKYQIYLSFLFIIFYLLWLYFSYESFRKSREVYLADINITVVNLKEKILIDNKKIYPSTFKLWDLEVNKILEDRKNKEREKKMTQRSSKSLSSKLIYNFKIKKKKVCLEKKCWEFMGMITIDNQRYVTLLSTEKKPKLETFSVGDELLKGLFISKIKGDSMSVTYKEKDKKTFVLKLFEVNASAYFPKSIKEINE